MKKLIRNNKSLIAFVIISAIVAAAGIAVGNELIYMLLGQYLILSLAGFICSACAAKKGKFLQPVIFTVIATLLPFIILGKTDIVFVAFSGAPCALGLIIGFLAYIISGKGKTKEEKQDIKEERKENKDTASDDSEDGDDEEISVEAEDVNASGSNAPEPEEVEEPEEALTEAE